MKHVTIRPLQEQGAYTSVKWRNAPEVFKYYGNTYKNEIALETEFNWIRKVIAKENEYRCAVLANDVYVRNICLTSITKESAHYHIFIGDKEYWGKGVAKKASKLILQYAFQILKLKNVLLRVKKQNAAAYHLYCKLGFVAENDDGEWIEMKVNNAVNKKCP